jgi:hypothetical protein
MFYLLKVLCKNYLYNNGVCPSKNEPQQQGIPYLEREKEGVRETKVSAGKIFKVRLVLGEIEGKDRETE